MVVVEIVDERLLVLAVVGRTTPTAHDGCTSTSRQRAILDVVQLLVGVVVEIVERLQRKVTRCRRRGGGGGGVDGASALMVNGAATRARRERQHGTHGGE